MNDTTLNELRAKISRDEIKQAIPAAARWYALLQSSSATTAEQQGWQEWLYEHPSHRLAWHEVEQVQASFMKVPSELALPALRGAEVSRRALMRRLGVVMITTPLAVAIWQLKPWQSWQAQYTTAKGQRQSVTLDDGSSLSLNTNTAVDVHYSGATRLIRLHRGEIHILTASDNAVQHRPLIVETPHGKVQALGTRFIVNLEEQNTRVTVLDKKVRIIPAAGGMQRDIESGQQLRFTAYALTPVSPADAHADSWLKGSLTVVDMPLRELLAELSRYRRGVLSCSDDIATLKISGAFPLDDTDRALAAIIRAFPIQEQRLTGYWVRLTRA
jgi:transmembrane sensor